LSNILFFLVNVERMSKHQVLVTGGAGYIGSHACLQLLKEGFEVVVIDNLTNSSKISLQRVEELVDRRLVFVEEDIRNEKEVEKIIRFHNIGSVIHFAGLKAVGESVEYPLEYYENNVGGALSLFKAMKNCGIKNLIFSSSATVYGIPEKSPITENSSLSAVNPYGSTKLSIEKIIQDIVNSDNQWRSAILRYFNPVGAHPSGKIGEDPKDIPNNLMPYITQVAMRKLEKLSVYGDDYDTPDGTGVRDYIHVMDLVDGHIAALHYLLNQPPKNNVIVNLGTGIGCSVLELIKTFEKINNIEVPYEIAERRAGDVASCYADASYAYELLNWSAKRDISQMCKDSFEWQTKNPNGFE
jgi:UDP-glucose 4-epimerase